jgi:hypothetical protein
MEEYNLNARAKHIEELATRRPSRHPDHLHLLLGLR